MSMSVVKWLNETGKEDTSVVGGKGKALGVLVDTGFNVPRGFAITTHAFFQYLSSNELTEEVEGLLHDIDVDNYVAKGEKLRKLVAKGEIPRAIALEVSDALDKLGVHHVAIRSSAASEDSTQASFAGLHDSFLNEDPQLHIVLDCTKRCWASLFNARALAYRMKRGIPLLEGMAAIVQDMIPAEVSGTVFTAHPDTGNQEVVIIECSWGLGDSVVLGLVTPDLFIMDKKALVIVEKTLGRKRTKVVQGRRGTVQVEVPQSDADMLCLDDHTAQELVETCLRIENVFSQSQDIEWCLHEDEVFVLQSRPLSFSVPTADTQDGGRQ